MGKLKLNGDERSEKTMNAFAQDGLWTHYAFGPQGSVAQRTGATGAVLSSSVNAEEPFGFATRG